MKYFSLFTGIGGFELGIQQAHERLSDNRPTGEKKQEVGMGQNSTNIKSKHSWQSPSCVGYSEIDKYAIQIYQKHFPNHTNYGDITKINENELPDFDLLCGGFPCQAFSIAGKRKGFEDTRGTLFFDIARILRAKQPRLLILENVKGILSHDNGETFKTIISTLDELGYDLQWQVLNSKNFGVPQNRERILIVGHLRGTPRPQVFPFTNNGSKDIIQIFGVSQSERIYSRKGVSPTLSTMQGGNLQPKIIGGLQAHQTIREDGISPTLTTAMGQGGGQTPIVWNKDIKIRRLTPKECERLQGFPDGWTEGVSDTQRYKTLGNAVTTNVIEAVVKKITFDL